MVQGFRFRGPAYHSYPIPSSVSHRPAFIFMLFLKTICSYENLEHCVLGATRVVESGYYFGII